MPKQKNNNRNKTKIISFITNSASQTKKLGEILAKEILKTKPGLKGKEMALVLGLRGDLGGGKTTFLQGLAKGFDIKEKVLSPTFVIMKKFKINNKTKNKKNSFMYFYHFDCYRIREKKEMTKMGFDGLLKNSQNIIAIEWINFAGLKSFKNVLTLEFIFLDKNKRKIIMSYPAKRDNEQSDWFIK